MYGRKNTQKVNKDNHMISKQAVGLYLFLLEILAFNKRLMQTNKGGFPFKIPFPGF